MKFLFVLVSLVFITSIFCQRGNATTRPPACETTIKSEPTDIHVHCSATEKGEKGDKGDKGTPCDCGLQDKNKPSAHIEGNRGVVTFRGVIVIKDWSQNTPNSHLVGGMTYQDGNLRVPVSGRYFVYAQLYYYYGRVHICVNNKAVTMISPMKSSNSEGSLYTGGVFALNAGDVITMTTASWPTSTTKVYMGRIHSFMGAFLI